MPYNSIKRLAIIFSSLLTISCGRESSQVSAQTPQTGNTDKALVIYYSYTGNCRQIVKTLGQQIACDIVEILPAEEGLDYAADNYAIGAALIGKINDNPDDPGSYPAIKAPSVDFSGYKTVFIVTPLWWSHMAAPMQTFLFHNGTKMADKNIALIVSSHSSGIVQTEADCKRLIPKGKHAESLWIDAANHGRRADLAEGWLKKIDYDSSTSDENTANDMKMKISVKGNTMTATLADNAAVRALTDRLKRGSITYTAHDYGGFEKVGPLGFTLPSSDTQITARAGDIMLYSGNQICIFMGSNSWAYTRIGKIEDMTEDDLRAAFGSGNAEITLALPD